MKRRRPLIRYTPLKRQAPLRRLKALQAARRALTAQETLAYTKATERARTEDGYLRCEGCQCSLKDGEEQRHHRIFRSHGGPTTTDNLLILCLRCHAEAHGVHLAPIDHPLSDERDPAGEPGDVQDDPGTELSSH
jgi:5-methylcytosine-specific restriction endonuclease McrA